MEAESARYEGIFVALGGCVGVEDVVEVRVEDVDFVGADADDGALRCLSGGSWFGC